MFKIAKNLSLPLDFMTERIAFLARTGAGKSGGMRVVFEQALDAGQFCVFIDPKGDAWGIRAAGKRRGYPVLVMGGDHGDVPLQSTAGAVVAEFLVRERVSTVLDVSDFDKAEMVRFVTDLAMALYRRNRDVMHVFIDEADMLAGEKFYDPKCLQAIQFIQNKGRHRGFGVTVASQRSAMLNKSVLNASGTLIAMQTTGPRDIKAIREWLEVCATPEATNQIIRELPKLKTREAFVYSPQVLSPDPKRITFAEFRTFDSMRTPKPGETRRQPKSVADVDLKGVERDMARTIEDFKANDPKELKRQIADLRRQLRGKGADSASLEAAEQRGERRGRQAGEQELRQLRQALGERDGRLSKITKLAAVNGHPVEESARPVATTRPVKPATRRGLDSGAREETSPAGGLTGTQQRLIDALAWLESIGVPRPIKSQIGAVALIDSSGGYFGNVLRPLVAAGLVEDSRGSAVLTDTGRAVAQPLEGMANLDDYHEMLRRRVLRLKSAGNKTVEALNAILSFGGSEVTNEEIADAISVDHTGGYFGNVVRPLANIGLIERRRGSVVPTEILFPEALV